MALNATSFFESTKQANEKLLAELAIPGQSELSIDEVKELVNQLSIGMTQDVMNYRRDDFQARFGVPFDDVLSESYRNMGKELALVASSLVFESLLEPNPLFESLAKPSPLALAMVDSTFALDLRVDSGIDQAIKSISSIAAPFHGVLGNLTYQMEEVNKSIAKSLMVQTQQIIVTNFVSPMVTGLAESLLGSLRSAFDVSDWTKSPYSVSADSLIGSAAYLAESPVYAAIGTLTSRDSLVSDWTKSLYSVSASDKLYPFVEHHRVEHPSIQRPSTSIDTVSTMVEMLSPNLATAITPSILSSVEYTLDRKLNDWAEHLRSYVHSWDKESVRAEIQAPDGHIIRLQGTSENIKSLVQDLFMGTISKQVQDTNQKPIPTVMKDGWKAVFDWYYDVPKRVCDGLEMLSEMIGYSHGTVKNQHALYRAELK